MSEMGKFLIIVGAFIVVVGLFLTFGPRIPFLGRLPGDIAVDRGNVHVYFPIVTCLVLSVVLTLILNLFFRR
jgi:membrane protein implicated in regulation of membrane protease activity